MTKQSKSRAKPAAAPAATVNPPPSSSVTEGDLRDFCRANGLGFFAWGHPDNWDDTTKFRATTPGTLNGWNQVGVTVEVFEVEKWLKELDSRSVREKIVAGVYDVDPKGNFPTLVEWREERNRLEARFRDDAIKEVGLEGHPKADKAFAKAYDRGHGSGYHEVLGELESLAELLLED